MSEHARLRSSDRMSFLLILLQLMLFTGFAWYYSIQEGQGFPLLLFITLPAFLLNAFLPQRMRPWLLVSIFLATCLATLGWVTGGFILFVSLALFTVAMLKLKLVWRLILIGGIIGGMIVLRNGLFFAPRAIIAVPYIASLFVFRLISYLYHEKRNFTNVPLSLKLSYFFMLPNLVFLLFPIIDYRAYAETYYQRPAIEIYRKGLIRISTGLVLLMIHRVMYYYCSVDPMDVRTLSDFLSYAFISYLLIIQIVGMFMICIGWVTLFGFDLPPIFGNFFFAKGFSDLWRRINHYWRDFIIKVFYFPLFFRMRKRGHYTTMVVAGLAAFFCSWMLHSQQLYWISGNFSFSATDGIYWMTMGVFITADGIYQYKNTGKIRTHGTVTAILLGGLRITGIFLFASVLWTIWNSDSLSAWTYIVGQALNTNGRELLSVAGILAGVIVVSGIILHYFKPPTIKTYWYEKKLVPVSFGILFVALIAFRFVSKDLPADSMYSQIEQNISKAKVTEADREMLDLGYYDQLADVGGIGRTGTQFRLFGDLTWGEGHGATHATGDVLMRVFNPNASATHHGVAFSINSLGLRDQEYPLAKPANTERWAFLGGSYILGPGLVKEQTFEAITEQKLNDSLRTSFDYAQYDKTGVRKLEILNYSMGGYMLTQQVALCKEKVFEASPDKVFYFCHPDEALYTIRNLSRLTSYGISVKQFPVLDSIVQAAGLQQAQSRLEMFRRLEPFKERIVKWGYAEILKSCRAHNAEPVWVFLPTTTDGNTDERFAYLSPIARASGFTVLDLSGVYAGYKADEIQIGEPDTHPNAFANRLIAGKLIGEIRKNNLVR